jgi:hypothetical protein
LRRNCLLKRVLKERQKEEQKWWEDTEEDVSSYGKNLRKEVETGNWHTRH